MDRRGRSFHLTCWVKQFNLRPTGSPEPLETTPRTATGNRSDHPPKRTRPSRRTR